MGNFLKGTKLVMHNPLSKMRIMEIVNQSKPLREEAKSRGRGGKIGKGRPLGLEAKVMKTLCFESKANKHVKYCLGSRSQTHRKTMIVVSQLRNEIVKLLLDNSVDINILFASQTKKFEISITQEKVWIKEFSFEPISSLGTASIVIRIGMDERGVRFNVVVGSGQPLIRPPNLA